MITVVIDIQGQAIPPTFLRAAEMSRRDKNSVVHILIIDGPASLLAKTALYPSTGEQSEVFQRLKRARLVSPQNTSASITEEILFGQ